MKCFFRDSETDEQVLQKSKCDCVLSYDVVKDFLHQYKRPFTVLDISANRGLSLQVAYDFPDGTFVMVEQADATALLDLCRANAQLDNIVLLNSSLTSTMVKRLSECEHFDVTFVSDIFHTFGVNSWKKDIDALINCSDHVIIEMISKDQATDVQGSTVHADVERYLLEKRGGEVVANVKRGISDAGVNVIVVSCPGGQIKRNYWYKPRVRSNTYIVISDFEKKTLTKMRRLCRYDDRVDGTFEWIRGINLVTFKMMHGIHPDIETVKQSVKKLGTVPTTDWLVSNMVIQGNNVVAIDCNDGDNCLYFSQKRLEKTFAWLDLNDPAEIREGHRTLSLFPDLTLDAT